MHISYPPHRESDIQMPYGFQQIQDKFNGLCVYSNNAAGARGLCNIPINTHSWRYPSQADPGFICGKQQNVMFSGFLAARNGVSARQYNFKVTRLTDKSGKFADGMIAKCAELGMKPVCDHPSYCAKDPTALYIGQDHHIGYPGHRNNNRYFPSGWDEIADHWKGMCNYAAKVQGGGN